MTSRGRLVTFIGGLLLLLGVNAPPGGKPQTVFVIFIALPLLVLPLMPRGVWQRGIGFIVGYTAVLTPLVGVMLMLNFVPDLAPLYLAICGGTAAALVSGIVDFAHSEKESRGDLFVLGLVGLLYFPCVYFGLHTLYISGIAQAQDLYRPLACIGKYAQERSAWPDSLEQVEPGSNVCAGVSRTFSYKRTGSGFEIHNTEGKPIFYADQSGIIHKSAPDGQVFGSQAGIMNGLVYCLKKYRATHQAYPSDLRPCAFSTEGVFAYSIQYTRISPESFHLYARPAEYGKSGVRSYYSDESLIIHGTLLDRNANKQDPISPRDET